METSRDAETDSDLVREEAEAAATEAANIGGPVDPLPTEATDPGRVDPAQHPVLEAGGGEAEGFEQAEALHRDRAENPRGPSPLAHAGREETEDPGSTYGEADDIRDVTDTP
jgi:hypothetical protein